MRNSHGMRCALEASKHTIDLKLELLSLDGIGDESQDVVIRGVGLVRLQTDSVFKRYFRYIPQSRLIHCTIHLQNKTVFASWRSINSVAPPLAVMPVAFFSRWC